MILSDIQNGQDWQGNILFYQVKAQLGPYLFFGGDNGFNVIDTQKNIKYTYIPIPAITSIRNGNKLFRIQELDSRKIYLF